MHAHTLFKNKDKEEKTEVKASASDELKRTPTELAKIVAGKSEFIFQEEIYQLLESTFDLNVYDRVCSVGASEIGREIIFLNMKSEALVSCVEAFIDKYNIPPTSISETKAVQAADRDEDSIATQEVKSHEDDDCQLTQEANTYFEDIPVQTPLKKKITLHKRPQEFLQNLIEFIPTKLKSFEISEEEIARIVSAYNKNKLNDPSNREIPLEGIMEYGRAMCRHISLLTARVARELCTLAEHSFPDFNIETTHIYHHRAGLYVKDKVKSIRHSVIVFEIDNHRHLVDAALKLTADITNFERDDALKKQLIEHKRLKNYDFDKFITTLNTKYNELAASLIKKRKQTAASDSQIVTEEPHPKKRKIR